VRPQLPTWTLLAVAAAMIAVVAGTVFKTVEVDNTIAWLFVGAALVLIGAWLALEVMRIVNSTRFSARPPRSYEDEDEVE